MFFRVLNTFSVRGTFSSLLVQILRSAKGTMVILMYPNQEASVLSLELQSAIDFDR